MKRIKIKLAPLHSRAEAEAVMNDLACVVNNQRAITAQRDAEILAINKRYEASLSSLATELQTKTESLRAWAETNPDAFPKGRKSIDFVSGVLGFRTGTPKLALLSRAWTWEKVLEKLKSLRWNHNFVRTKEEIDKEAVLAAVAANEPHHIRDDISMWGLKVAQDESFFIEPKLADMGARQTSEAA